MADVGSIIVNSSGFIAAVGAIAVGFRGQNRTDKNSQIASILEGYDEIVTNLREENQRLMHTIDDARSRLEECEKKCEECQKLLADLRKTQQSE